MRRIRFSRRARLDLIGIGDWIAQDRPRAARRFVEALIERTTTLADHPELGPLRPIYGASVRGLSFPPYVILYRVSESDVFIERVVHGARLPKNLRQV
ncbi:type II toxin-antitoxin system RelE/ParE family toxin [Caulobacter sp. LARHSG274]